LKPDQRIALLLLFVVSFVSAVSPQDSNQSLGDVARQERERKQKQGANSEQTDSPKSQGNADDASETAGLKAGNFKANILITDSHAAIEKWVLMPEADRSGAGRIRQVIRDKKFYLPFVVTGYTSPASEKMNLTAHVRLISPDGKTQFDAPRFSETIAPDPRSPSVIVLNPVMDITFDSNDLPGTYTIRVTVTDHVHSAYAKAEEQFQLISGTSAERKATKKPATAPPIESR
jgi:hypothetical protein